jgi:hypothetical protein
MDLRGSAVRRTTLITQLSVRDRFKPINLILKRVGDASLKDTGNIGVVLARLMLQGRHCSHDCGLNLLQVQNNDPQLPCNTLGFGH